MSQTRVGSYTRVENLTIKYAVNIIETKFLFSNGTLSNSNVIL